MEEYDHIERRNNTNVTKKNVLTFLETKSDNLIIRNNLIIKLLKIDILGENNDEAWKKVDDTLKEINELIPKCILTLIRAVDFNNSSHTNKKTGVTKKSASYGYPHINLLVLFKNTQNNENEWNTFVEKFNEKNKYIASKDPLKGEKRNANLIGFVIKNHNNKYLKEKLNNEESVQLQFFKNNDFEICKQIKEFFTKLKDLDVKIADPNEILEEQKNIEINEEAEKTSRPEDTPFLKFFFEFVDYMKQKKHRVYSFTQTVFEQIPGAIYSFKPELISKGNFNKYLERYVDIKFEETRDPKLTTYMEILRKDLNFYFRKMPQIEYYDFIEFKNCIYSIKQHYYWKKEFFTNYGDDKEISKVINKLKENFSCLRYFDVTIDLESKSEIFNEILDNSFDETKKNEFLLEFSNLFQDTERRDKCLYIYGETKCGKSSLMVPLIELYGEENIGKVSDNYNFGTEFLVGENKRIFIFDEYKNTSMSFTTLLKLLEGVGIIANPKCEKQAKVQPKRTVILSNLPSNYLNTRKRKRSGEEYEEDPALEGRLVKFEMKTLVNEDKKCISKIKQDIPAIIMQCNNVRFGRKALKKKLCPLDNHPEVISILEGRKLSKENENSNPNCDEDWNEEIEDQPPLKQRKIEAIMN